MTRDFYQAIMQYYFENTCPLHLQERIMNISIIHELNTTNDGITEAISEINGYIESIRLPEKGRRSYIETYDDELPF